MRMRSRYDDHAEKLWENLCKRQRENPEEDTWNTLSEEDQKLIEEWSEKRNGKSSKIFNWIFFPITVSLFCWMLWKYFTDP